MKLLGAGLKPRPGSLCVCVCVCVCARWQTGRSGKNSLQVLEVKSLEGHPADDVMMHAFPLWWSALLSSGDPCASLADSTLMEPSSWLAQTEVYPPSSRHVGRRANVWLCSTHRSMGGAGSTSLNRRRWGIPSVAIEQCSAWPATSLQLLSRSSAVNTSGARE